MLCVTSKYLNSRALEKHDNHKFGNTNDYYCNSSDLTRDFDFAIAKNP